MVLCGICQRIKKIENFFISERVIKIIGIIVFIQYKQRCGSYKKMMDNINHKYNLSNKSLMNVESYVFFLEYTLLQTQL